MSTVHRARGQYCRSCVLRGFRLFFALVFRALCPNRGRQVEWGVAGAGSPESEPVPVLGGARAGLFLNPQAEKSVEVSNELTNFPRFMKADPVVLKQMAP